MQQGCPIYGKISVFYRFFYRSFSTKKKRFMAESTDFFLLGSASTPPPILHFRDRGILRKKNRFLVESTDLFVLCLATTTAPPPPDVRLPAVFRAQIFFFWKPISGMARTLKSQLLITYRQNTSHYAHTTWVPIPHTGNNITTTM